MLEGFVQIPILPGSSFLSVTENGLNFNKNVVKHMNKAESVILLCNSSKKQLAIQKCDKDTENSIPFYRNEKNLTTGVRFNNREIQQMIAAMMNWNLQEFNYRADGFITNDRSTMIFNLNSARVFRKRDKLSSNKKQALDKIVSDI